MRLIFDRLAKVLRPAPAPTRVDETDALVDRFAQALKAKLRAAEAKHGWDGAWQRPDAVEGLRRSLYGHVLKGDPRDVAAIAAMLWHHAAPCSPPDGHVTELTRATSMKASLIACGRAAGAFIRDDASDSFVNDIPAEVRLVCEDFRRRIDTLQQQVDDLTYGPLPAPPGEHALRLLCARVIEESEDSFCPHCDDEALSADLLDDLRAASKGCRPNAQ